MISTPTELRGSRIAARAPGLSRLRDRLRRVYDYARHELVFHGGAVQDYRGVVAMLPDRDLGVRHPRNSESALAEAACCRPSSTARSACLSLCMDRRPVPRRRRCMPAASRTTTKRNPDREPARRADPTAQARRESDLRKPFSRLGCGKGLTNFNVVARSSAPEPDLALATGPDFFTDFLAF